MRTEQEVLNDFENLGWKVVCNSDRECILEQEEAMFDPTEYCRIHIYKKCEEYTTYIVKPCKYARRWKFITMQEHKLLTDLFKIWGWL